MDRTAHTTSVAIIGMAGRFPGARTLKEFWENLIKGQEAIVFASPEELSKSHIDPGLLSNPDYVPASSTIHDPEYFDAGFFGFSARDAEIMDPQQRVFLECAWEALEDAACDPSQYRGLIGVFAGMGMNSYGPALLRHPEVLATVGAYQVMIGNDKDFLCSRVAYKLNLRGPAVSIQTACSSSLVAVQVAHASLLRRECDVALAGGVSIPLPQPAGYLYTQGMIMSRDGHCRPFDAASSGTVQGAGAGVVVLKRMEQALEDGDHIYAVIHGAAINNDGAAKVGYSAPGVEGQQNVIRKSMEMAGFDPASIRYIEAHGTGTEVGDPIEFTALARAFASAQNAPNSCALGALKSNIGHLDAAAGVAGLIKAALSVKHRVIPPTLHFTTPNPLINLAATPFYVNTAPVPVVGEEPFRAGVSSFGIGGTNAHVSLQESPPPDSDAPQRSELIVLSAKSVTALDSRIDQLREYLECAPEANIADLAFTLQTGRRHFQNRHAFVARNVDHLKDLLRRAGSSPDLRKLRAENAIQEPLPVAFLLPGQGAQYVNMGRNLYERAPIFRETVDHCAELLQPLLGRDLRAILYPEAEKAKESEELLAQTSITQPAIFTLEYAAVKLWNQCGITPAAMLGHSVGEYVAACIAGVFSLEDALCLIAERGRLIQSMPSGAMLAASLAEQDLQPLLSGGVSIAAVNSPSQTVASGPEDEIAQLETHLKNKNILCRRLRTSHAFHSGMMDPVVGQFVEHVKKIRRHSPRLRWLSNVSGTWITSAQAVDPAYWGDHLRCAVRFADCAANLFRESDFLLLEAGPGNTLGSLIRGQSEASGKRTVISSIRPALLQTDDYDYWLAALGALWLKGLPIEWQGLRPGERRLRLSLPTYPFERQRYWLEPANVATSPSEPLIPRKRSNIAEWLYVPSWKRMPLPVRTSLKGSNWLVFADDDILSRELIQSLRRQASVVEVRAGTGFQFLSASCTIRPENQADYHALASHLLKNGGAPERILHLWKPETADCGLIPAMLLVRALEESSLPASIEINLISERAYSVFGETIASPAMAALHAFWKAVSVESPKLSLRILDVDLSAGSETVAEQVAQELGRRAEGGTIAYRSRSRWLQSYEPLRTAPPMHTSDAAITLRSGGTYLITGGLGGLGLVLGHHIANRTRGQIVLLSRNGLPPEDQGDSLIRSPSNSSEWKRKIESVQRMRASGAQIDVIAADVTDIGAMRAVLDNVRSRYGAIHGIIHAAGVNETATDPNKLPDQVQRVLAPKVQGTEWIREVLPSNDLDFIVLCSSLSAELPVPGLSAYSAANAYLNGFAATYDRHDGTRVIAVNWDAWSEVGMAATTAWPAAQAHLREQHLNDAISPAEGIEIFDRILAFPASQILVSTRDLTALQKLDAAIHPAIQTDKPVIAVAAYRSDEMVSVETGNSNDHVEGFVVVLWQEMLGATHVGANDNFFELGGHSLMGTQLLSRVREKFGIDLPLRSIFEAPTPAKLAEKIRLMLWASSPVADGSSDTEREEIEF